MADEFVGFARRIRGTFEGHGIDGFVPGTGEEGLCDRANGEGGQRGDAGGEHWFHIVGLCMMIEGVGQHKVTT